MIQILVTPKGTLNAAMKAKLLAKDCINIESDEPEKIKLLQPSIENSDFFISALKGLASEYTSDGASKKFVKELYDRLSTKK